MPRRQPIHWPCTHNFESGDIEAFFAKLSKEQLRSIDDNKSLRIQLTMSDMCQTMKEGLTSWLRFAGLTLTRATTVDACQCEGAVFPEGEVLDNWLTMTAFSMEGHRTYRAYQRNQMARQEWERIKVALHQQAESVRVEQERQKRAAMSEDERHEYFMMRVRRYEEDSE
ncbi:hypothetical protein LTR85_001397 [Meristemomyces frigidus]|nr:hypothetical protein LTR85_001397 [Meristemomyces frigidus]